MHFENVRFPFFYIARRLGGPGAGIKQCWLWMAATLFLWPPNLFGQNFVTVHPDEWIRSQKWTRPFFNDAALTIELSLKPVSMELPGERTFAVITEMGDDVMGWDHTLLEIAEDGTLLASLPGVPSVSTGRIEFGVWHHVALRYNPAREELAVFLNGVKAAASFGTRLLPWASGQNVRFALGRASEPTGSRVAFVGNIDEVRIWRVALADETIRATFDLILEGPQPDQFAMWSFDSIVNGNQSPDRSGYNNPAEISAPGRLEEADSGLRPDQRPLIYNYFYSDAENEWLMLAGNVRSRAPGTAYFLWGEDELTNQTESVAVPAEATVQVVAFLNRLEFGRTYRYRLVVVNEFGTATADGSFTKRGAPSVLTPIVRDGSGALSLQFSAFSFRNVELQSTEDFHTWRPRGATTVSANGIATFQVTPSDLPRAEYFRIRQL